MTRRMAIGILGAPLLAACGPTDPGAPDGPAVAEYCVHDGATPEAAPQRDMSLGHGDETTFAPYHDGEEVELVAGYQGGFMITPVVRVQGLPGDGDDACWMLALHHHVDGLDGDALVPGLSAALVFLRAGEHFYSGALNDLLTFDRDLLAGANLDIEASIEGRDVQAEQRLRIRLR